MKRVVLPFTAIVGQQSLKQAIVLNAINPSLLGVLIRGEKGTGKSTAVRALAALLPEIEVVKCPFNCSPVNPALQCDTCPFRRIIFVEIDHTAPGRLTKERLFSFGVTRIPVFFIDINTQTGKIINAKQVEKATAWGDVPTPPV